MGQFSAPKRVKIRIWITYHIVWVPKCRRKVLYGRIRKHLADLLHCLARQKGCKILELNDAEVRSLASFSPWRRNQPITAGRVRQGLRYYFGHAKHTGHVEPEVSEIRTSKMDA